MRDSWQSIGSLGPIHSLVSQGLSDRQIAKELALTEPGVHRGVAWILYFLNCRKRTELVEHVCRGGRAGPPGSREDV